MTLVEQDQGAYTALQQNARALGSPRLELLRADALEFATSTSQRYDLIFLDPPFRHTWIARIGPLLPRLANPGARLYVEAEHAVETLGPWRSVRQDKAGQVSYQLLEQA